VTLTLRRIRSLVVIGAHPDDIEIGAGGLMLSLAAANPGLVVRYALLTGTEERVSEARAAAQEFLPGAEISFHLTAFPDGRLPAHWAEVKAHLHELAGLGEPDLVLSPYREDAHQDHRLLGELVPTVFRSALVLQYEIPKWDGDFGRPSVYVPLDEETAHRKVELLHESYPSQKAKDWWDSELFLGLARLRGMECRSRYAEAYYANKIVLAGVTR